MLVVTSAWLCRREAVGLALKGTSGGIRSRAIYLSCSLMIGLRARLLQMMHPCIVPSWVYMGWGCELCVFITIADLWLGPDWLCRVSWPFQFAYLGFATSRVSEWPEGRFGGRKRIYSFVWKGLSSLAGSPGQMSCLGTGAPTRGWNPISVPSARRSLLEATTCPNTSRCIDSPEATAPSAPWTDQSRFPLPAQPSYSSRWQHFAHYISSDNLFVFTQQSMLLLDTTMSECPMSFKDDLRMKFFLGQGRGVFFLFCLFFF